VAEQVHIEYRDELGDGDLFAAALDEDGDGSCETCDAEGVPLWVTYSDSMIICICMVCTAHQAAERNITITRTWIGEAE
jgi:hypothetical protein